MKSKLYPQSFKGKKLDADPELGEFRLSADKQTLTGTMSLSKESPKKPQTHSRKKLNRSRIG